LPEMKRTLICWIMALSMGVLSSHAQTDATRKEQNTSSSKAAEPKTPQPPVPSAPAPGAPDTKPKADTAKEVAVIKTSMGDMVLEFWPDVAPKHVENFKKLAKQGFYDGTAFHRVIKGFMIQGGDPNTKDESKRNQWGMGGPGYRVNAEVNDRKHTRGVLSMARSNDPNSAGSQFFICLAPQPSLDNQYTTFGKLIKGDEVLEKIGSTATDRTTGSPGARDIPLARVNIDSIKIVPADSVK
jgi:peptidyl-prolyl cis-trans isomerase B (cyclophilin B)